MVDKQGTVLYCLYVYIFLGW